MLDWRWTRETTIDFAKLCCATLLFAAPWILAFEGAPAWNLWACGYATIVISLAALTAEADWEPGASFCVGVWAMLAPWILGFSHDTAAVIVHGAGGLLVCVLSAIELWKVQHDPPRRFRPGAASRLGMIETPEMVSTPAVVESPASL